MRASAGSSCASTGSGAGSKYAIKTTSGWAVGESVLSAVGPYWCAAVRWYAAITSSSGG